MGFICKLKYTRDSRGEVWFNVGLRGGYTFKTSTGVLTDLSRSFTRWLCCNKNL